LHLEELIDGGGLDLEVEHLQNLAFLQFQGLDGNFLVADFVVDGEELNRVDLFQFGSDEHAGHPRHVHVLRFGGALQLFVKLVHQVHAQEKGGVCAAVAAHYLHHPVHHLRP